MKRPLVIAWLSLMIVYATPGVQGDDWSAPTVREVFSESREWFVHLVPGTGPNDAFGLPPAP